MKLLKEIWLFVTFRDPEWKTAGGGWAIGELLGYVLFAGILAYCQRPA